MNAPVVIDGNLYHAVLDRALAAMRNAEVFSDPFPHIRFRDLLPADIYSAIVGSSSAAAFRSETGTDNRVMFGIDKPDVLARMNDETRELWRAVGQALKSPELEAIVRDKLREGLDIRARGDKLAGAAELRLASRPQLTIDRDGYAIRPHPDTRKKIVTMQLYCPKDDGQRHLGTTFYRASLQGLLHPSSYFLEPVKTMPFLPNTGYAFVVLKAYHSLTRMSWHGRPKIAAGADEPRMSIFNTWYDTRPQSG
jgi:hypothetical protein